MSIPSVTGTIKDGGLGATGDLGVNTFVIVGPATSGALGTAGGAVACTSTSQVVSTFTSGPAVEAACYLLNITPEPPTVLIWRTPNTTAATSAVDVTGVTGSASSHISVSGTALDSATLTVTCTKAITCGTAGGQFTVTWGVGSPEPGPFITTTSLTVAIGNGITLTLGQAADVWNVGDVAVVTCVEAMAGASDVTAAITGVCNGGRRFRAMLVTGIMGTTEFATVDTACSTFEASFDYAFLFANTRDFNANETDAQYTTAMDTLWGSTYAANKRISLCGGFFRHTASPGAPNAGRILRRPAAWAAARRFMEYDPSVSLAEVDNGPLAGASITDSNRNSVEHDERINGGIGGFSDPARLLTLRTIKGRSGCYITLPWMKSAPGSDFIRVHLRAVMDIACATTHDTLESLLSEGVPADTTTGLIDKAEANNIQTDVDAALAGNLLQKTGSLQRPRASSATTTVDTTVPLLTPGSTLPVTVAIESLIYLEKISFTIGFVNPALLAQQGG